MNAGKEWTEWRRRGTTTAPQQSQPPHSVDSDACSILRGLERLSADLCRSLGAVSARSSALSDPLLQWSGGQDARLWQPREDRVHIIPLSALWSGEARGGDELQILLVLAMRQSRRGQLGQPGQQGPPRRRHLSAYHPDGASHVGVRSGCVEFFPTGDVSSKVDFLGQHMSTRFGM